MTPGLLSNLLASITSDNLVIFCGAGLSMAKPSSVPSAASVASDVAQKYQLQTTVALPPNASTDLEVLSSFAYARGELRRPILEKLINWRPFIRNPNAGHFAIADFLAAKIIQFGISTNFDALIEMAAEKLGEDIFTAALDGDEALRALPHHPLLKIHGCCKRDQLETLWCKEQLNHDPIKKRVSLSKTWLQSQLRGKDIVFIGFWSDWDYLNDVIEDCIDGTQPSLVVLVDPSAATSLQSKAPKLWAWANTPPIRFHHEPVSGADFLDELRKEFSINFLTRILRQSSATYATLTGNTAPAFTFDRSKPANDFYSMRLDYEGIPNTRIGRAKHPSASTDQLGAMHFRFLGGGASLEEPRFILASKRVRLVQGAGRAISMVQNEFLEETPPITQDDVVVCVGAVDNGGAPAHLIRGGTTPSVVRATSGKTKWITSDMVTAELGI